MNSCEIVTFVSSFACLLSQCLTEEEIELLAVLFTQLGDTLATSLVVNNLQCNPQILPNYQTDKKSLK